MPYIIHHNDDDGRCSAAIAMNEIIPIFAKNMITTIEYNYTTIDWLDYIDPSKFIQNDIAIIVDLSLCSSIIGLIRLFVDNNVKVIHIDHHKKTFDYMEEMTDEEKKLIRKITTFYDTSISASMLTWIYSCMNDEEKARPSAIKFDFTPSFSHVMLNVDDSSKSREYRINPGIFYIDDYDIWRHSSKDTLAFHYGFASVKDKNPKIDKLWGDIIYGMDRQIHSYIDKGQAIAEFKQNEYDHILKRGHCVEIEFEGKMRRIFTVNNTIDSFMFESIKSEYDACLAYWYDAKINKWHYSVRSGDDSEFDCNKFAQAMSNGIAGGHLHSAGFISIDMIKELQ